MAKYLKYLILFSLVLSVAIYGYGAISAAGSESDEIEMVESASEQVYICTGPHAKVYHSSSSCKGLKKCSGQTKKVSVSEARSKYNRRACKICR